MEKVLGVIYKVGMVAKIEVLTRLTEMEDMLVEMKLRVVIRHKFMQFWLILRQKILMR